MILIAVQNDNLQKKLTSQLKSSGVKTKVLNVSKKAMILNELYEPNLSALVVDEQLPYIPSGAATDILNSIGRKIPVIVVRKHDPDDHAQLMGGHNEELNEHVTVILEDNIDEILTTAMLLDGYEGLTKARCRTIPYYNSQVAKALLKANGGLGVVTIDASNLSRIGVDYGFEVFVKVRDVFRDILFNLWGKGGFFRENDIICRRSSQSNIYYVFISKSRDTQSLPLPGAMERIADRIAGALHNELWRELFARPDKRRIPPCVQTLPFTGVGFYGVLYNPCIEPQEVVDAGLEGSKEMAAHQLRRWRGRQRELMQTLIQANDLLKPQFQGIFHLKGLTRDLVEQAKDNVGALRDHIYGFESLIRVAHDRLVERVQSDRYMDSQFLRPDVLFSIAKTTKVALELDQACMRHSAHWGKNLPGFLMVNILPRNLYYIQKLIGMFKDQGLKVILEVSESEAINNLELMLKSRDYLNQSGMGIAADDFGRGYSSLDRIIKLRPEMIKLDRSMVSDIHNDPVKQTYVAGLVKAAEILKTTLLAEGIEQWEEAEVLQQLGVELIQGYLLHRPEAPESIEDKLNLKKLSTVA